jgi:hypothetical protein
MSLQLENRDRSWLAACGLAVFVVLLAAYWVPTGPRRGYENSVAALESAKEEYEMTQLLEVEENLRIQSQQSIREQLQVRPASFNFFTEVDRTVTEAKLKDRAQLNRVRAAKEETPQDLVELRLTGVSLEEVVDFLHRVYEKNNLIAVHQMNYLRPQSDEQGLECSITLATIKPGV